MCGHCFTVCYVQYVLLSVVIQPSWLPNPIKVIMVIIINQIFSRSEANAANINMLILPVLLSIEIR